MLYLTIQDKSSNARSPALGYHVGIDALHDRQEPRAVMCQLGFANALDATHSYQRGWFGRRELMQSGVVKNHVGRNQMLFRQQLA